MLDTKIMLKNKIMLYNIIMLYNEVTEMLAQSLSHFHFIQLWLKSDDISNNRIDLQINLKPNFPA